MILKGRVHRFGSNINTDYIISGKYRHISEDMDLMVEKLFSDLDSYFYQKVERGDIIVAEENFGCGSSREYAPRVIKHAGICAVVAKSFARIFFRNSINIGLTVITCDTTNIKDGDTLTIDLNDGSLFSHDEKKKVIITPYPDFIKDIVNQGGLVNYIKG